MRELFRELDLTKVSFYKMLLDEAGIPTLIRNEYLTGSGLSEIPIPEFFPALCVLRDEDHEEAVRIIREHLTTFQAGADTEVICGGCGEANPGNFSDCWSCGGDLTSSVRVVE